ncbi:MAG: hypothetical protein MUC50_03470 [Myxococcota bacterium]|jgi:hypothetical protein|nr:hypothetical protein [Myxococcota bacterium]
MSRIARRFALARPYREWLRSGSDAQSEEADDGDLAAWVLRKMTKGELCSVSGVLVDKAIFEKRFACVPQRCSPLVLRDKRRSCCADLTVFLSPKERGRLARVRRRLACHLRQREPALADIIDARSTFFLEEDGTALARPHGRCALSKLEKDGAIRCHLHAFARALGQPVARVQPISCGLFPLALFELPNGRVLLTVLQASNHKLLGALPPHRFPCLSDDALPPLLDSMAATIDGIFGKGFAKAARALLP